jgi:radical SAM superfamily enzyme YgiQ (UPF0313 family)
VNVLLVDNLIMPEDGSSARLDVHPHLGLLALAASAEADGHRVRIYDPKRAIRSGELAYDATLYERAAAEILRWHPDVVGFTTLGCSFIFAVHVAAAIKRREPELPVVLGGPHATMLHREVLERFPQFDAVVRHEADEIFPAVLANLERRRFDAVPGLSWRTSPGKSELRFTDGKPKVADLDRLPIYSYDHYPVAELGLDLLRIEAGRGCPFSCTFCSTAGFFQRSFRLKSAERLVRELDLLHERYGYSDFKLDHDMFTVNRKKVIAFCEAVRGRGYRWRASARVDCVDAELLAIMREAGCVNLYFGIETGSARMQQICQKKLDLGLVAPVLDAARDLGMETTASFITGYPEENEQDHHDTLDMVGRCFKPACLVQLHILAPEPGTPMFDRLGAQIRYDGYGGRYNAELLTAADEQLVRQHPEVFQTYYYYPTEIARSRHIFAVEALDLIRRAGPVVVAYTLRAYAGRLSALVEAFRAFADARGLGGRPRAETLEAYLSATFGATHHLTSLWRYALRANEPAGAHGDAPRAPDAFDPRQSYRVSPQVHVLDKLHDCGRALAEIQRDAQRAQLVDDARFGDVGLYLLRAAGDDSRCARIDPGVEGMLSLFADPRTPEDAAGLVRAAAGLAEFDASFFAEFVREQILVPCA